MRQSPIHAEQLGKSLGLQEGKGLPRELQATTVSVILAHSRARVEQTTIAFGCSSSINHQKAIILRFSLVLSHPCLTTGMHGLAECWTASAFSRIHDGNIEYECGKKFIPATSPVKQIPNAPKTSSNRFAQTASLLCEEASLSGYYARIRLGFAKRLTRSCKAATRPPRVFRWKINFQRLELLKAKQT